MPGLVTVKRPPDAPLLQIMVPNDPETPVLPRSTRSASRHPPSPSLSTSRVKPLPDRKKKSPLEKKFLDETSLNNTDLGPFLLKLARDTIASGEGPNKALEYTLRSAHSFERCAIDGEPSLDLVMSLHVVAAIYCSLGRFEESAAVLEKAIKVPDMKRGAYHALAVFLGYMQLGDAYSMLGQLDRSIECYQEGLKIQMDALGDIDPRVADLQTIRE